MDSEVLMFLVSGVLTVLFFAGLVAVIAFWARHDLRAEDEEHRSALDFSESDLEAMSSVVEDALLEFSVNHISQAELNHVREDAASN